ncbi:MULTISPECIES: iron-containing redox enzyme family protein [Corallococcus]|uniref:iron-containing redox enzyme family protein n=1 Tax=Corallococcus TaxID=83461 RepID=UPI00117EE648|nr:MULTISPECIES: iron-containing redox enzyme family protein [Corallococcus]NBD09684.1 iron-containing redox enzyme family protein [Corallococcus silvisoli]TSC24077.1 iron-containing redox enzyme family protein [Corallococcus sp. Z5C101001]
MSGLGEVAEGAETEDARLSERLHRALLRFNQSRLAPGFPTDGWQVTVQAEARLRLLEGGYVEAERQRVAAWAAEAPEDADGFLAWFEDLRVSGPGQRDPLFPWLATQASLEQLRWFLTQELAGEAGFDDLVALTQLQLPTRAKLELARNYWDEMGRGREDAMHGPMLAEMAARLGLKPTDADTVWEAHAQANLLCAFAFNRRYAFHAVGALGIVEETAPGRTACVNEGLKRLGFDMRVRRYYAVHSTLDVKHSATWNREVLHPLVAANPACARPLAEGALLRLDAGARCFERYRRELGLELKSLR